MSLQDLVQVSRTYGSDPDWVLAGGGNTSYKDDASLWVKASGFQLATITPEGFARMDRRALQRIWSSTYPHETQEREAEALKELMAARAPDEEKRPSVETLMHELFPFPLVVHTHPALANGLTCGQQGQLYASRLFGSRALWVPAIEPGYVLAVEMRRLANEHAERVGSFPQIVFLQNHGLVVAGESPAEIDRLHDTVARTISSFIKRTPDLTPLNDREALREQWMAAIEIAFETDVAVAFVANAELDGRLSSAEAFEPLESAFTPDHIVYAGTRPLYAPGGSRDYATGLRGLLTDYRNAHGALPRIVAVEGVGVFAVEDSQASADRALALFLDEVKIAAYADSFGGARHLDPHLVDFIESWEVERYRKKQSGGAS